MDFNLGNHPLQKTHLQAVKILQVPKSLETQTEKNAYNASLQEAADGFEKIFVHKMIKVMRESTEKTGILNGGRGEEIFQDMLDEQYANLITKTNALGLSKMIYEHTKK